jgi:hypothetical protein
MRRHHMAFEKIFYPKENEARHITNNKKKTLFSFLMCQFNFVKN